MSRDSRGKSKGSKYPLEPLKETERGVGESKLVRDIL